MANLSVQLLVNKQNKKRALRAFLSRVMRKVRFENRTAFRDFEKNRFAFGAKWTRWHSWLKLSHSKMIIIIKKIYNNELMNYSGSESDRTESKFCVSGGDLYKLRLTVTLRCKFFL